MEITCCSANSATSLHINCTFSAGKLWSSVVPFATRSNHGTALKHLTETGAGYSHYHPSFCKLSLPFITTAALPEVIHTQGLYSTELLLLLGGCWSKMKPILPRRSFAGVRTSVQLDEDSPGPQLSCAPSGIRPASSPLPAFVVSQRLRSRLLQTVCQWGTAWPHMRRGERERERERERGRERERNKAGAKSKGWVLLCVALPPRQKRKKCTDSVNVWEWLNLYILIRS